jgi:hypothetical protein
VAIWRSLVAAYPNVTQFQNGLSLSLVGMGQLLKAEGRLAEAADAFRQAVANWERLPSILPGDHYNAACTYALLAGLAGRPGSGLSAASGRGDADRAMTWLHKAVGLGFRSVGWMRIDPDLEAVRARPDFQLLVLDLGMPDDPFAP